MSGQCQATNSDGEPCGVSPGEHEYCHLHRGGSDSGESPPAREDTKHNDIRDQKIMNALRECGRYDVAAAKAGIGEATLHRWRRWWPQFDRRCIEARVAFCEDMLGDIAQADDWRAQAWIVENILGLTITDEAEEGADRLKEEDADAIKRAFFGSTGTDG